MRWWSIGKLEIGVSRDRILVALVGRRVSRVLLDRRR